MNPISILYTLFLLLTNLVMHSIGSEVAFEGAKKNIWKRTTCNMQNEESHTIRNHTKLLTFDRAVGQLDSQISNTIHTIHPEHSE